MVDDRSAGATLVVALVASIESVNAAGARDKESGMNLQLYSDGAADEVVSPLDHLETALSRVELPRRRPHELLVLSCYLRHEALAELIERVRRKVRLDTVRVLFDVGEVFAVGPAAMKENFRRLAISIAKRDPTVGFAWSPAKARNGVLLHAKGYAVVQYDGARNLTGGCVLVGSVNATRRGLGLSSHSNVELGYLTDRRKDLGAFVRLFAGLWETARVDIEADVERESEELFRYGLLASGVYLAKWSGSIRSLLSLRFRLTEKGVREVVQVQDDLKRRKFEVARASLGRLYVEIPGELQRRDYPPAFSRECTVETGIGRFCPAPIWAVAEAYQVERDREVVEAIRRCLSDEALRAAKKLARGHLRHFEERGWMNGTEEIIDGWLARMLALREDSTRIARILRGYNDFLLPYPRTAHEELADLYESLELSLEIGRKRESMAKRLLNSAIANRSLRAMTLDDEAKARVRSLFEDANRGPEST